MRAWLEIDLGAVSRNFDRIRQHAGSHVGVIGVVKSDAYGHGVQEMAKLLERKGALACAVIDLHEAQQIREASNLPVLILGYLDDDDIRTAIASGFVLSLYDRELAHTYESIAASLGRKAVVHLKVETGLNRLGMSAEDAEFILANPQLYPHLRVEALYSHLATSSNHDQNTEQLRRFELLVAKLDRMGIRLPMHFANSHALPNFPEGFFQAVRVGLALYGVDEVIPGLEPSLTCKAVVIQRKRIKAGEAVSYNKLFRAPKDMDIAVLAIGYGEGLSQGLTGKLDVLIAGRRTPVVGQICMNLCIADVTHLPAIRGDEAVIVGKQTDLGGAAQEIKVVELAQAAGLRHHEILCRFGRALPRIYLNANQPLAEKAEEVEPLAAALPR